MKYIYATAIILLAPLLSRADDAVSKVTSISVQTAQTRYGRRVVSFHELRQSKLVRQSWDTSCGAAALSTLLTYHVGIAVSEYAIATHILRGGDPGRVRQRGGFSLLDLKRFVEALGLVGEGYGSMTLADLDHNAAPAIVPVRLRELDHFVVFRGRVGNRVLLGDPAFGNMTMPVEEFETVWRSRIAFYVQTKNSPTTGFAKTSGMTASALDLPVPDLGQVSRLLRGAGPVPAMRQLPLVARTR
jgi:uncharacterized protein